MPRPSLTLDNRIGSIELEPCFRSHRTRPNILTDRLTAADICFSGSGPSGPCLIGVERKRFSDMLSSMRTDRFSGEQLPKLVDYYDYIYLVVEGQYRANAETGLIEVPALDSPDYTKDSRKQKESIFWVTFKLGEQQIMALELESYLNSLSLKAPVRVKHTPDHYATVDYVMSLTHTFSKPWDRHRAHLAIHTPEPYTTIEKASAVRRFAYAATGIGWEKSGEIERWFPNFEAVMAATPDEIAKLPGFGKVVSRKLWEELHGRPWAKDG